MMNRGGEPAGGTPLLFGITKASLSKDSQRFQRTGFTFPTTLVITS
jgi:hypothetical protein